MFDGSLPEIGELAALEDAAVVDAAGAWARVESAACARKQAAMAEMFARRTGLGADERELWWVDPDTAVTAELSAALNVSQGIALHQTHRGVALRDRLPKVAELFAAGLISDLLVRAIVWRTYLIDDADVMAKVDAALVERVGWWGSLSVAKTEQAIDALVEQFDPGALRQSRASKQYRDVSFGSASDEAGFTSMWARLLAGDAKVFEQRVNEIAATVCEADPRTLGERRSDALTAIGAGHTALVCGCGDTDCDAANRDQSPPVATVVNVVAGADTVAAAQQQITPAAPPADPEPAPVAHTPAPVVGESACDADPVAAPVVADASVPTPARVAPTAEPDIGQEPVEGCAAPSIAGSVAQPNPLFASPMPSPTRSQGAPPAYVMGGGILPTALLAETLKRATVREIVHPGDAPPEPGYRASAKLARFVRCRDLTCRWPGCDKPADVCDLDHTVPYPHGPTHASNLKCLCRFHHLLKTFWGWCDRQCPDGAVVWTTPTGHTYTTHPGAKMLFPTLCEPTATLWPEEPPAVENTGDRGAMMPKRRHARAENKTRAINAERRLNDDLVAERNRPPPF